MQKITSRENAKLKLARKVRDGRVKDLVFIEGLRLAEEALRSKIELAEIFVAENFERSERAAEVLRKLQQSKATVSEVAEKHFVSIADTANSQGIILLGRRPETDGLHFVTGFSLKRRRLPVVLLLHEINNPSNLGAILRTAEAVNISGVILTKNSADVFSPKALRASMGAALRLNLWTNAGFDESLAWAREENLIPTAADVNAERSYAEIDWQRPRLLIFGSEAHGLSRRERAKIDEQLVILMDNGVESLNLAVSSGIILFEAKRQANKTG